MLPRSGLVQLTYIHVFPVSTLRFLIIYHTDLDASRYHQPVYVRSLIAFVQAVRRALPPGQICRNCRFRLNAASGPIKKGQ